MGDDPPATKATGTPDALYDLILVLQQALEDCVRYQHCADDARREGDDELAGFFDELAQSDAEISQRAQGLLRDRLNRAAPK